MISVPMTNHPSPATLMQRTATSIVAIALVVVAMFAAGPIAAQGTDGFIPEPISSKHFQHEIKFLDLDWPQRIAAEAAHETYKESIKSYRESAIEKFIEETAKLSGGGFSIPSRDQVADILKIRDDAITRINAMDRRLFDEMSEILREDQQQEFARFQRVRERSIHESSFLGAMLGSEGQANLVDAVRQAELDPDAYAAIEQTLTDYEIAVNIALKNRNETSMDMILKGLGQMAEFDMSKLEEGDQQAMMEAGMAMQRIMMEVMQEAQEAAQKVTEVTTRFHRQMMTMLPADAQPAYEEKYLQAAYPKIYAPNPWPSVFIEKTLDAEDIAASDKETIRNIRDQWQQKHASVSKEMRKLTDENREEGGDNPMAFMMGGGNQEEFWNKWSELEQERSAAATNAHERIMDIVSAERAVEINEEAALEQERLQKEYWTTQSKGMLEASYAVNYGMGQMDSGFSSVGRSDYAVSGPISEKEFESYAKRLAMSDDEMIIAKSIFENYQSDYEALNAEKIVPMLWGDENTEGILNSDGSTPEKHQKKTRVREEAMQLVAELDESLFRDLAAICTEEQLKNLSHVQTARAVQRMDAGEYSPVWQGNSAELSELVGSLNMSTDAMQKVSPKLAEYEKELLPILNEQMEAFHDNGLVQAKAQKLQTDFYEKWGDEPDPVAQQEMWQEYSEIYQGGNEEINELNAERRALEDEWLPELTSALPYEESRLLQKAYNQKRYPSVYPDMEDAALVFDRVAVIRDLNDEQRAKLDAIMSQHTQEHDALSRELIEIEKANEGPGPWQSDMPDEDEMAEWQRLQMRGAILRYDRTELNETTRRALRAALTQEQAAQVPGLDVERVAAGE